MSLLEKKARELQQLVAAQLEEICRAQEPRLLYEPVRYVLASGGKRIRPLLVMLSAEAVGGDSREAAHVAAAVELLHTFTLVHDDIMDQDDTRRGQPTIHAKWDVGTAILAGDGLVALAYRALLSRPSPRLAEMARAFTEGIVEVCEGQALDKEFETRPTVTMDAYLAMIGKKTACLLATSCHLGALVGGGQEQEVTALRTYGRHLGVAFQIQDDLLDLLSPAAVSGKPRGSDLAQRKQSFPLVAAQSRMTAAQQQWLAAYLGRPLTAEELNQLEEFFRSLGVVAQAEALVRDELAAARGALARLRHSEAVEALAELSQELLTRIA
ncbi:MAG: polyprenyl synthetase family protein [Candidatus Oleimicrobiaceae bacterium]